MTEIVKRTEQASAAGGIVAQYLGPLTAVLPRTGVPAEAFTGYVQAQLDGSPKLALAASANALSFIQACMNSARLGHVPDGVHGALVPYGINENYQTGELTLGKDPRVEFIEMYQGLKQRLENASPGLLIHYDVVRQQDIYQTPAELGQFPVFIKAGRLPNPHPFHSLTARGPVVGAFAYARLPSGLCSPIVELGAEEIERYRPKDRDGKNRKSSFWDGPWLDKMQAKTALLRLEKLLPTSSENLALAGERIAAIAKVAAQQGVALPALDHHPEYEDQQPSALPAAPEATT